MRPRSEPRSYFWRGENLYDELSTVAFLLSFTCKPETVFQSLRTYPASHTVQYSLPEFIGMENIFLQWNKCCLKIFIRFCKDFFLDQPLCKATFAHVCLSLCLCPSHVYSPPLRWPKHNISFLNSSPAQAFVTAMVSMFYFCLYIEPEWPYFAWEIQPGLEQHRGIFFWLKQSIWSFKNISPRPCVYLVT